MSRRRRRRSRRTASSSSARQTPASATWPCASIQTGTRSFSTGGTRRMSRAELLERYRELPLPTTKDEAWRFTDLRGFDPDSFSHVRGQTPAVAAKPMLDLTVSGMAKVSESSLEIEHAPQGVTFEPLGDHPRLHELVGWDEKFAAHNAALWQNGLLVVVPRGVVLDEPLYVRVANAVDGGSLFWRLLVIAEAGSRFTLIEEYASAGPDVAGYSNAG